MAGLAHTGTGERPFRKSTCGRRVRFTCLGGVSQPPAAVGDGSYQAYSARPDIQLARNQLNQLLRDDT